jgi:hypothetical protein
MKRRVIYMSDEDWAETIRQAKQRETSASAWLRSLVVGGRILPQAFVDEMERIAANPTPGFNTRPFTPVPKKGK